MGVFRADGFCGFSKGAPTPDRALPEGALDRLPAPWLLVIKEKGGLDGLFGFYETYAGTYRPKVLGAFIY